MIAGNACCNFQVCDQVSANNYTQRASASRNVRRKTQRGLPIRVYSASSPLFAPTEDDIKYPYRRRDHGPGQKRDD